MKTTILYLILSLVLLIASFVFTHYLMFGASIACDVAIFVCLGLMCHQMDKEEAA